MILKANSLGPVINIKSKCSGALFRTAVLKILENSYKSTCGGVSFSKIAGLRPVTLQEVNSTTVVFLREFSKIFKATIFISTSHVLLRNVLLLYISQYGNCSCLNVNLEFVLIFMKMLFVGS